MNIGKLVQLGVIISLPVLLLESLRYIFLQEWLGSVWLSLTVMLACIGLYFLYVYSEKMVFAPFKERFLSTWIAFATALFVIILFRIFIHNVLDTRYRTRLAERVMTKVEGKLREIEEERKIEIERTNGQIEKQKLIDSFSTFSLIKGFPQALFVTCFLSLILAALAKRYV